jgi:hypothetical protein
VIDSSIALKNERYRRVRSFLCLLILSLLNANKKKQKYFSQKRLYKNNRRLKHQVQQQIPTTLPQKNLSWRPQSSIIAVVNLGSTIGIVTSIMALKTQ